MSGASGFVGILARRQPGPGDSHMPIPGADDADARRARYALHMAKELDPDNDPDPPPRPLPLPAPAVPTVSPRMAMRNLPKRRRAPAPLLLVIAMAIVLLLVGTWAAGAIFYMQSVHPTAPADVHYPLLRWQYDTTGTSAEIGAYARHSVTTAWTMLLCLPVGLALAAAAVWAMWHSRPRP
jgi:hypothetical protein